MITKCRGGERLVGTGDRHTKNCTNLLKITKYTTRRKYLTVLGDKIVPFFTLVFYNGNKFGHGRLKDGIYIDAPYWI